MVIMKGSSTDEVVDAAFAGFFGVLWVMAQHAKWEADRAMALSRTMVHYLAPSLHDEMRTGLERMNTAEREISESIESATSSGICYVEWLASGGPERQRRRASREVELGRQARRKADEEEDEEVEEAEESN